MEFACVWDVDVRGETAAEEISVFSQPFLNAVSGTLAS